MTYEEFYHDCMQDIYARSEAESDFTEAIFTEKVCDFLVEQAVLENYTSAFYKKSTIGIRVDAYDFSEETGILTLIVTDFNYKPDSLTQTAINAIKKRGVKFFEKSLDRKFYQALEESDPGYKLARDISTFSTKIQKVRFILLSSSLLSKRVEDVPDESIGDFQCSFDIWDLGRIQRIEESGKAREDIIVDFTAGNTLGLPCLPAFTGNGVYKSYLLVMPGQLIANLYEQYGERLLEQNVRTFLQFRGKVNKGIRNTIQNEPEMFFAYNNGITATAEEVTTHQDERLVTIRSIKNFQIVNGGQTTASLFNSNKDSKINLAEVYVQVKLTIIPSCESDEIVPKISEYANTQNKVSAADFFSNHPFHLRIEGLSRRLWAPSRSGSLKETHWYYERVRGQYANAQTNLTTSEKNEFITINPRKQMFVKTDLAKFEGSWSRIPHIVSQGAQKNFVNFAAAVAKEWTTNNIEFNELYFQRLIAKAILFRTVDNFIMKQPWYGGYKANIVTYTISKFSQLVEQAGMYLDFLKIWARQEITPGMEKFLATLAETANKVIQDTPPGITNVTEWCKREMCWSNLEKIDFEIPELIRNELISKTEKTNREKDAKAGQTIDNGIEAQKHVFAKGASFWKQLLQWGGTNRILTPMENSLLITASQLPTRIPDEKQSMLLIKIEKKAVENGFRA